MASTRQMQITEEAPPSERAEQYSEKISGILGMAMRATVENPNTVADAAAILEHGPNVAKAWGELADQDERVRRAIDIITAPTSNPYAAAVIATLPMVVQIMRNHEDTEIDRPFSVKIPFVKREFKLPFRLRFRVKNAILRSMTLPKEGIIRKVFSNREIVDALTSEGLELPFPQEKKTTRRGTAQNGDAI